MPVRFLYMQVTGVSCPGSDGTGSNGPSSQHLSLRKTRGLEGRLSSPLPAPGCTCSFVSGSSPQRKELLKPEELASSRHLTGNSLVTLGKRSQPEEDGPGSCTGNGRGGGHHRLKVNRMIEGGLQAGLTTVPWETLLGTCLLQV